MGARSSSGSRMQYVNVRNRSHSPDYTCHSDVRIPGSSERKTVFDTQRAYQAEATKYPLLTAEDEKNLSMKLEECHRTLLSLLWPYRSGGKSSVVEGGVITGIVTGLGFISEEIEGYHYRESRKRGTRELPQSAYEQFSALENILATHPRAGEESGNFNQMFELLFYKVPRKILRQAALNALAYFREEHNTSDCADYIHQFEQALAREKRIVNTFVNSNLRLAIIYATRTYEKAKHFISAMDAQDIIQFANMGLMRAVDKYDYHAGARFCTYATPWIRQSIARGIAEHSRTIRFSADTIWDDNKLYKASSRLEAKLGRRPTDEELAQETGIQKEKIRLYSTLPRRQLSLHAPAYASNTDTTRTVEDFIADENAPKQDEAAEISMLKECLKENMSEVLTFREKKILQMRFGMEGHKEHTLKEAGEQFGITRERARQIEAQALEKLRKRMRSVIKEAG